MKLKKVHLAKFNKDRCRNPIGYAYAACSGWMKVPYTLLISAVTCKNCLRMIKGN